MLRLNFNKTSSKAVWKMLVPSDFSSIFSCIESILYYTGCPKKPDIYQLSQKQSENWQWLLIHFQVETFEICLLNPSRLFEPIFLRV